MHRYHRAMPSNLSSLAPASSGALRPPFAAWRRRLGLLLMFVSGFAGLAYQIVWTQQCAVWLGHETAAVLAVVAAFFGGLALGALTLGDRIAHSAHPTRWYAACEALIAAWCIALAFLIEPLGGVLVNITGPQPNPAWEWAVSFCGTFLLLLPATLAMGATLPAMERVLAQMRKHTRPDKQSIAALYASNTFGAVVGVLASAFWLIPAFGLLRTSILCAVMNLSCAATALYLRAGAAHAMDERVSKALQPAARKLAALFAATGLLGIGYEVLVVRVLSQVAEDTVYTFAMLLAVYLCGTALGAAAYQRWFSRRSDDNKTRDHLLAALAAACLLATLGLWFAEMLKASALELLGASMNAALGAEALLALAAFGLPTFVMGALFSHLTTQAHEAGISFGRALAFNTLGAAFAPVLFGVVLMLAVGPKFALLLIAVGYLGLTSPRVWRQPVVWAPAAMALVLVIWTPPLAFVDVPEGGHVVSYRDGAMSAVSVVEDAQGVMRLRIDNRQQEGSSDSRLADARQALLPLLLHPSPKQALFLGLGTGVTAFSAAEDPSLQVDAVELLPEVIAASDHFTRRLTDDGAPSRLHTIAADARHYVRASSQQYDVIVSDNFHPARSGSAALYTVEHFRAVQQRLAPGGLFCQWLPLHQLDTHTLRSIVKAFITAYPDAHAVLATNSLETPTIGLIGSAANERGPRFDMAQVTQRLATATWPQAPADFGFNDAFAVLGSFIAGPASLARFSADAKANTDDHPVVAYMAPRITYAPDSLPRDRLAALLGELSTDPAEMLAASSDETTRRGVAAYWTARNRYIEIGRKALPSNDVQRMLAQVREPLLSVLRTSPDFRPAYDPLLRMATALTRIDPAAARSLLTELAKVQPARLEAAQALNQLSLAAR
ncbi:fused MFS/spermidine synthase [Uliginosibacterium sp. H3]|uniref:Fused MFS/spermidine synthase n=1 Tax=Uliginosibacterium silvisoli TaxID=3114758 RepID=A0ABU6K686_9RHOO|nr:fused MFS/spermidine synthase [Uliginosibacterium sp. H3]